MEDSPRDMWLLAVDGSRGAEHAARYVAKTAKAFGAAEIRLVNVRPPPVGAERMDANALRAAALAEAERTSAKARRIVELAGLPCTLDAPVGDDPAAMKRLLRQASKETGVKVRSSWEDDTRMALLWKRVGA